MIEISWINKVFKAGWQVSRPGAAGTYLFSKKSLDRAPRNLRKEKPEQIKEGFFRLFSDENFISWWDQTCGGKVDKFLRLRFPSDNKFFPFSISAWDIPWELLIERLKQTDAHATISLVRSLDVEAPSATCVFDVPLRVLILQGDDGGTSNRRIDLDAEASQILQAWDSLDTGTRECIERPEVHRIERKSLPKLLAEHEPHIIWFSGHGKAQPHAQLLFADGEWVSSRDLAGLIKQSCSPPLKVKPPLYAVFWACDTGRPDAVLDTIPASPSLFKDLTKIGVVSVLCMQSPIRDKSALAMAHGLFAFLAAGFPLERALARVRARLIDDLPAGGYELDWATPVVWSAGNIVERLTWNNPAHLLAQFQLLGREALRCRRKKPSELDSPPSADELNKADIWASMPRVWVHGRYEDGENQYYWVRALQAIQVKVDRFVVAVDLRDGDVSEALQEWAENVDNRLLPGDFPHEVAKILGQIKRNPISGWTRLCNLRNIYLAIAQPPDYSEPDWFWKPLLTNDRTAVFSAQEISGSIQKDWQIDRVGTAMSEQKMVAAIKKAPRLARAMAVLNMPLSSYLISVQAEKHEGASDFLGWPEGDQLTVDTSAGPIMVATARQYILKSQDPELLKIAHQDCVRILNQPQIRLTTQMSEELLRHSLGADLYQYALEKATDLCFLYREQDRPSAVLQLLKQLGPQSVDLPASARLIIGWAYLQLGKVEHSEFFLERTHPTGPLDSAWKHGLLAEIYKSLGTAYSKETALEEIDKAIDDCRRAVPDSQNPPELIQKRLRAYRQDRARILQFLFYEREKAAAEYEELIKEWSDQPDAVIDLAVVKRNYAECLRSLATDPADPRRRQAKDILQEAEQLLKDHPHIPVLAEILYEKAKAAEAENRSSAARQLLLDCQKAALQSQHYMVWAIAESKLFRSYEPFSLARWEEVQANLEDFPNHGWAVRTLVRGKLRVARKLESEKDFEGAFKQLESAKEDMDRNPSFNRGSDRFLIAATRAGLEIIRQQIGRGDSYWVTFTRDTPWADEWLQSRSGAEPEAIWREVQ